MAPESSLGLLASSVKTGGEVRSNAQREIVAQLVEHGTFNAGVVGSSPTGLTRSP